MVAITPGNLTAVLSELSTYAALALDTETTGLDPRTSEIFAIAFTAGAEVYYCDFRYSSLLMQDFKSLLEQEKLWIGHNIKFDSLMVLSSIGTAPQGELYCTQVHARVQYNQHLKYDLESCAIREGFGVKAGNVTDWLDEHGHYKMTLIPGKKKREKIRDYSKLPADLLAEYICQDVRLAWQLYEKQQAIFKAVARSDERSITPVLELEKKITSIVVGMENYGIRVDRTYCTQALEYETARVKDSSERFTDFTGVVFTDSEKVLQPVFDRYKLPYGRTEKGAPSFTDDVLASIDSPIADAVRDYRDASKRASGFFSSFLYFSEPNGRIHASFRQAGTATGRFSCSDPNLQQLTNEDENPGKYPVRRAFVPDDEYILVSCDYSQMEYRLMLDYAGEMEVIRQVQAGVDLHEACAKMMGVSRREAKTINFSLLFGSGVAKLAEQLKTTEERAAQLKQVYFKALPNVCAFIRKVGTIAKTRGYVINAVGRRYYFPDKNFAYKATNYLIQGGCADIMRKAMVGIHQLFTGTRSRLILTIHDEVVCLVHKSELHLVEGIKRCMVEAYQPRFLAMDANLYYSTRSLHDLKEWTSEQEARDTILGERREARFDETPRVLVHENAGGL